MKAKLVKKQEGWYNLYQNDIGIGSTHSELQGHKLSLENCQAIERGYDLNEEMSKLVDKKAEQNNTIDLNAYGQGCLDAFQKALELMGDKKFSEYEMIDCWETAHQAGRFEEKGIAQKNWQTSKEYIQSLQQTEWDVEVQTEELLSGQCNCECHSIGSNVIHFMPCCNPKMLEVPKLDVDGCLILKI
jgi:hypothetical protein